MSNLLGRLSLVMEAGTVPETSDYTAFFRTADRPKSLNYIDSERCWLFVWTRRSGTERSWPHRQSGERRIESCSTAPTTEYVQPLFSKMWTWDLQNTRQVASFRRHASVGCFRIWNTAAGWEWRPVRTKTVSSCCAEGPAPQWNASPVSVMLSHQFMMEQLMVGWPHFLDTSIDRHPII
jgi:hypothetical protein